VAIKLTGSVRTSIAPRFLLLFGLPFLAVGVGMSLVNLNTLARYQRAQAWPEVPARILEVELKVDTSGDSTTYEVRCRYEYERHGQAYVGERVGLSGGSDNIGSWHQNTYARLSAAHQANQPVPCYVNPAQPDDALLVRELRFGLFAFTMLFATIFGSIGLCLCATGASAWRESRRDQGNTRTHPDEPWMHNAEWAEGVLHPRGLKTHASIARWLAVYWNAVCLPMWVVLLPALLGPQRATAALAMLFPLAGLGLAAYAVYRKRVWRRWGRSLLELETLPGVIGGSLRGTLVIVGDVDALEQVKVTLQCTEHVSRGKNSTTRTTHEDQQVHTDLPTTFGQTELELPVEFEIPRSCAPTGKVGNVTVRWQLLVRGSAPGVDLSLKLDVPVFVTAESDSPVRKPAKRRVADPRVVQATESPVPDRVRVTALDATTRRFESSSWPGFGLFVGIVLALLVFGAASVFMIYKLAGGEWPLLFMLLVFVPINFVLLIGVFVMLGRHTLTVSPYELHVRRSWGPIGYERRADVAQISSVDYKQSASSNHRTWYAVHAHLLDGKKLTLAGMLPGEPAAQWMVHQVRSAAGLDDRHDDLVLEMSEPANEEPA